MRDCYCAHIETPIAFSEKEVVARKSHLCCECGGTIQRNERYKRCSGIWDNGPATYKTCPDCMYFHGQTDCECIAFGDLGEWLKENMGALWPAFQASRKSRTEGGAS